jgi:hypothetical protein
MKKLNILLLTAIVALSVGCSKTGVKDSAGNLLTNSNTLSSLASAPGDVVGKVTIGYQGWFSAAGDGSPLNSWQHQNLENWPDVREYTHTYAGDPFQQAGVVQPPFNGNLGNGQPAKMFSSDDQQVANTHCLWMQQNGIDCIALQRFGSYTTAGTVKDFHDAVDLKMMTASQTYGRKFFIMYDCNATSPVTADWTNTIVNAQHLTSSSAYAKQNGKPVVCLYGIALSGRGTNADWLTTINWFKNAGCYVIGSVTWGFSTNTDYASSISACNMLMPWAVGRTSTTNFQAQYTTDLNFCNAHGIDYQADIYPGTSFYNSDNTWPKNKIPRTHGNFMWQQFAAARQANVKSVYISMFDEMNEATGILKCAEDASMIPAGKYFLTLDADGTHVSSDFYLRLTNDGGKMVKGTTGYTATEPTPFVVSGNGPIANGTYKIINRNGGLALDVSGKLTANGTAVDQYGYTGATNQQWTVTNLGGGQYKIIGVQSGRSLDVTGQLTADGTPVDIYDYKASANQLWTITATSGGYYSIIGVQSGKPLEVKGNVTTPGALVDIYTNHSGNNQQWAFQAP